MPYKMFYRPPMIQQFGKACSCQQFSQKVPYIPLDTECKLDVPKTLKRL